MTDIKSKKPKKQRQNVHVTFQLSSEACGALTNALDFLLSLNDFSFAEEKINWDSASAAAEKLFDCETDLTRGEVRATAKAISEVLSRIPVNTSFYSYVEEDYPNLLSELERDIPLLKELQPIFEETVKQLKKM